MKIAQLVCVFPPYKGGIGQSAKIFQDLLSSYYKIHTYTLRLGEQKSEPNLTRLKTPLRYGHGGLPFQVLWKLRSFDYIYLHYPFFGMAELIWFYKLILGRKKKLIIHYHMDVFKLKPLAKILKLPSNLIIKSLFKKADLVTCFSLDYVKNSQIKNIYQKHKSKFKEIPFGVDVDKFSPDENSHKGNNNFIFIGGLDQAHYFKGLDYLLEAVANISQPLTLDVVGEGELKKDYQEKCRKLKIENKVRFLGTMDEKNLIKTLRKNNTLVLPSIDSSEAFGIVLLEAMACGLTVIASDLPGVRSVFKDKKQGFLINKKDSEDLEEKIKMILSNPKKAKQMQKNARKLAEEKYSLETLKKNLNQVIESL